MERNKLDVDTRNLGYRDREYIYTLNYEQNLLLRYLLDKVIEDLPSGLDEHLNIYDLTKAMNNCKIQDKGQKKYDVIYEAKQDV